MCVLSFSQVAVLAHQSSCCSFLVINSHYFMSFLKMLIGVLNMTYCNEPLLRTSVKLAIVQVSKLTLCKWMKQKLKSFYDQIPQVFFNRVDLKPSSSLFEKYYYVIRNFLFPYNHVLPRWIG